MSKAGEMAQEMHRILRALDHAGVYMAGMDQADAARGLTDRVAYSPLRTLLEQASEAAQRIEQYLREQARS